MASDVRLICAIFLFRLGNALLCSTFFQPDEFWQSLEVAHRLVHGYGYSTWEWQPENALRSPLIPMLFTPAFALAQWIDPEGKSSLHIYTPKLIQAGIATMIDLYTYKLGKRLLGPRRARAALACSLVSLFNAYVSIRAFSNSVETALTAVALSHWPWYGFRFDISELTMALIWASLACIIRPPNAIIWLTLGAELLVRTNTHQRIAIVCRAALVGLGALLLSFAVDSLYYGRPTLTPLNFARVNVLGDIATFYGANDWHFYLSQGLPALTFTFFPFALRGAIPTRSSQIEQATVGTINLVIIVTLATFSLLRHKELRFVQPFLPLLHILAARPLYAKAGAILGVRTRTLAILALTSLVPALYLLQWHMRGQVDIMAELRKLPPSSELSFGFLMPCHSTPWQSHLHRRDLGGRMWFLTCEPPLKHDGESVYMDQSDVFYADPSRYLLDRFPSRIDTAFPVKPFTTSAEWRHTWPTYLVLFDALLQNGAVKAILEERGYVETKRIWNSHWHEDPRRAGDIVVLEWRKR